MTTAEINIDKQYSELLARTFLLIRQDVETKFRIANLVTEMVALTSVSRVSRDTRLARWNIEKMIRVAAYWDGIRIESGSWTDYVRIADISDPAVSKRIRSLAVTKGIYSAIRALDEYNAERARQRRLEAEARRTEEDKRLTSEFIARVVANAGPLYSQGEKEWSRKFLMDRVNDAEEAVVQMAKSELPEDLRQELVSWFERVTATFVEAGLAEY